MIVSYVGVEFIKLFWLYNKVDRKQIKSDFTIERSNEIKKFSHQIILFDS